MKTSQGTLDVILAFTRVVRRAKGPMESVARLKRRPMLLLGLNMFEMGLAFSGRAPTHLKLLAQIKAAALVRCDFCLDLGSAVARELGVNDRQLLDLPRYDTSDAFSDLERLVLAVAVALTQTPAEIPTDLLTRLRQHLDDRQIVEVVATVAWENFRSRFNRAFDVQSANFCQGKVSAVPEVETSLF